MVDSSSNKNRKHLLQDNCFTKADRERLFVILNEQLIIMKRLLRRMQETNRILNKHQVDR